MPNYNQWIRHESNISYEELWCFFQGIILGRKFLSAKLLSGNRIMVKKVKAEDMCTDFIPEKWKKISATTDFVNCWHWIIMNGNRTPYCRRWILTTIIV